jgi:hypothetical protein
MRNDMKKHLVIAGTGRAGTSFLVQYLTACGLETHITRYANPGFDENANAGFEDVPLPGADLPYVIKSPWLYEFVDRLLERDDIALDAVIVPMRDIVEAASSRVILEMQARYGSAYGHPDLAEWESWAQTPGGVVFSLNALDQARILAMGFHEMIRKLVHKNIPIVFVDFPRMVTDAAYLWEALEPAIGSKVSREAAIAAHQRSADPAKVRTGSDLSRTRDTQPPAQASIKFPSFDTLDRSALIRELERLRKANDASRATLDQSRSALDQARAEVDQSRSALDQARTEVDQLRQTNAAQLDQLHQTRQQVDTLGATIESQQESIRQSAEIKATLGNREREERAQLNAELDRLRRVESQFHVMQQRLDESDATWRATVESLKNSTSWRLTEPLRWAVTVMRGR